MHWDAGSAFFIPLPVTAVPAADGADICRGRNRNAAITLRRETKPRNIADRLPALRAHDLHGGRKITAERRRDHMHELSQNDLDDA